MSLDLEAIKARADAATAGPWKYMGKQWIETPVPIEVTEADYGPDGHGGMFVHTTEGMGAWRVEDNRFIAAARTDVPALLAEVESLRKERDDLAWTVEQVRAVHSPDKRRGHSDECAGCSTRGGFSVLLSRCETLAALAPPVEKGQEG